MADWVLKGSLKGPKGDDGADAQLPEGGTVGDFLKKTSDGADWFNSEGLLRASHIGTLQQIGDDAQSLEIHDVSVTSNGYVAGIDTADPQTDGAYVYADDTNSAHLGHNRVGVEGGIPYVDLQTGGEGTHLAADGRYSYVDDIEAADTAQEEGDALTIPTGAAVKSYISAHAGDALPEGGTTGQVLTKTADGEAWQDAPKPDMYQVLKTDTYGELNKVNLMGETINVPELIVTSENEWQNNSDAPGGLVGIGSGTNGAHLMLKGVDDSGPAATFTMNSKSVTSITDAISTSPSGNALVTDKAVADYVAANAPEVDLTGYAYLHPSDDTTINPDTVDIRTLEPGVYRVAMGSYVDNGEMVDIGVNNTQFPDAMVHMTPYGVDRTGILTVSKTVRNDDSGNEMLFYDLQIGYPMGDGEVDRFIAQCPSPSYALDSGNWKQIPKDSDIPKDFLVISSDGNLKEFSGGYVDELVVGLATENNRASMGYFSYGGIYGVNFVARKDDDKQAFMQASSSSSHVEVAHSGNQIGIGANAGGAFIAVKQSGGSAVQYSIGATIDGTNSTIATGDSVIEYVAENAGGGGLELLWEGSGTNVVVNCDMTDYALLACVAQNTYDGSYGQGLIRPIPLGASQSLRIRSGFYGINVSNNSAITISGGSVALRYIYGLKASGWGAVAPEQTYRLNNKGVISYHKAGEVLVIANGISQNEICLYQQDTEEPVGDIYTAVSVSDFPDFVQEVFASQPSTLAPPPTSDGYAWAIMPPCDCYVFYS